MAICGLYQAVREGWDDKLRVRNLSQRYTSKFPILKWNGDGSSDELERIDGERSVFRK